MEAAAAAVVVEEEEALEELGLVAANLVQPLRKRPPEIRTVRCPTKASDDWVVMQ